MSDMQTLLKSWIDFIKSEKLQDVIEGIKDNINSESNGSSKISTKDAFKLLLYLSHTASKCNRQNYEAGKKIFELTSLLCSILSTIPDNEKFASSLFHITRCLLSMHLYSEAANICLYLIQESFVYPESKTNEIFVQLIYLWHDSAEKKFVSLQKNPRNTKDYHEFKNFVENELQLARKAYNNNAKRVLIKLDAYLKKIATLESAPSRYIDDFSEYIFQHQKYEHMVIDKNDKYQVYHLILSIISRMIRVKINEDNMKCITHILEEASKYLKCMLSVDKECFQSFLYFKAMCTVLLKPAEELTEFTAKGIQNGTSQYIEITQKYGYANTVSFTIYAFSEIFEYLFLHWERNLKLGNKQFLSTNTLYETMKFIASISAALMDKPLSGKCMCSNGEQCTIKTDLYNTVALKARCVVLISKLSAEDLPKNICKLATKFMEENMASIKEMKENNCKYWTSLWSMCGRLLYNMGAASESFYGESSFFISLLCSSIIYLEGIHSESLYLKLQNPICIALYRLSNIHYCNDMFREAMTVSALHGLLSYKDPDSKAFKMWASIKHRASKVSTNLTNISMISCLQTDIEKIEAIGLRINFSEYNLIELCLSEAKGLQTTKVNLAEAFDSVLKELKLLKATSIQRGCVIQLLGYHLLHFQENYTSDYFQDVVYELELLKNKTINVLCLKANLEFFTFVNELHISNKHTQMEIESTGFALHAPKGAEDQGNHVVPTYSKINIKEDIRLMGFLQKSLQTWNKIEKNMIEIAQSWEPLLTLRTLIVIAEYSRLYRYEECELKAWNLAIELALELQNYGALIYATGRNLSLRQVNYKWLALAKEHANKLKDSDNENIIHAIAIFWISLADFYFECGECTEASKLLDDARCLPGISFQYNTTVYLYSLVTILHNFHLYKKDTERQEYTSYIVESLYSIICLKDSLDAMKWMYPDKYLFSYDILFSSTIDMSLKINSLLSSREITAHLVQRLKTAQAIGATMRTAEILKSLCFIDLSRSELDDCEVKLQGLEHILNIETIKLSMNAKLNQPSLECLTPPNHLTDPIRDTMQSGSSPILRRKVFNLPDFMLHHNCTCVYCQRTQYQYLVFASTHIRAQLYALRNQITNALEHFHGAFQIRRNLFKVNKPVLPKNSSEETDDTIKLSWQTRLYITDYVLLLLHFSCLLKTYIPLRKNEAINIALLAVDVCETHNIESHPIYISAKELVYENYFQEIITDNDHTTFTVPQMNDIDISKFSPHGRIEQKICVTPATHNTNLKKPLPIRRNKTPPLLKLKKINIDLSDNEEEGNNSPSLGIGNHETPVFHSKMIRRKILESEYSEGTNTQNKKVVSAKKKLASIAKAEMNNESTESISIRNIITKVAPSVPDISDHLNKIADNLDIPATNEAVERLIEMVENLEISTHAPRKLRTRSTSNPNRSSSSDTKIRKSIALFKKMVISEVAITDSNIPKAKEIPNIIIDDTEASAVETIALDKESNIPKENKPETRVTRNTRSTKSTNVSKAISMTKKRTIR